MSHYYLIFGSGNYLLIDRRCRLAVSPDGKRIMASQGFNPALHMVEAADEAAAATALGLVPFTAPALTPQRALALAVRDGLSVTTAAGTFRLRCADHDRAAFAQLATLMLSAQAGMTAEQKTAHRATTTMIVDATGTAHSITIGAYQELVVAYGLAYHALWAAAAAS